MVKILKRKSSSAEGRRWATRTNQGKRNISFMLLAWSFYGAAGPLPVGRVIREPVDAVQQCMQEAVVAAPDLTEMVAKIKGPAGEWRFQENDDGFLIKAGNNRFKLKKESLERLATGELNEVISLCALNPFTCLLVKSFDGSFNGAKVATIEAIARQVPVLDVFKGRSMGELGKSLKKQAIEEHDEDAVVPEEAKESTALPSFGFCTRTEEETRDYWSAQKEKKDQCLKNPLLLELFAAFGINGINDDDETARNQFKRVILNYLCYMNPDNRDLVNLYFLLDDTYIRDMLDRSKIKNMFPHLGEKCDLLLLVKFLYRESDLFRKQFALTCIAERFKTTQERDDFIMDSLLQRRYEKEHKWAFLECDDRVAPFLYENFFGSYRLTDFLKKIQEPISELLYAHIRGNPDEHFNKWLAEFMRAAKNGEYKGISVKEIKEMKEKINEQWDMFLEDPLIIFSGSDYISTLFANSTNLDTINKVCDAINKLEIERMPQIPPFSSYEQALAELGSFIEDRSRMIALKIAPKDYVRVSNRIESFFRGFLKGEQKTFKELVKDEFSIMKIKECSIKHLTPEEQELITAICMHCRTNWTQAMITQVPDMWPILRKLIGDDFKGMFDTFLEGELEKTRAEEEALARASTRFKDCFSALISNKKGRVVRGSGNFDSFFEAWLTQRGYSGILV